MLLLKWWVGFDEAKVTPYGISFFSLFFYCVMDGEHFAQHGYYHCVESIFLLCYYYICVLSFGIAVNFPFYCAGRGRQKEGRG